MSDKTLYGGWPLNYYRGAIDSAIDEIDRIEQAMGVQASRIRARFEAGRETYICVGTRGQRRWQMTRRLTPMTPSRTVGSAFIENGGNNERNI